MASWSLPRSPVKGHIITTWMCWFVTPLQIVLRSVACWQFAVVVLVLQLGRYDGRLPHGNTSTVLHAVNREGGQGTGTLQDAVIIWMGTRCVVALVPVLGWNPEKVRRRWMRDTLHRKNLTASGHSSEAADALRVAQFLRKEDGLTMSQNKHSVAESSPIAWQWQPTVALLTSNHAKSGPRKHRTLGTDTASKATELFEGAALQAALITLDSADFIIQPFPDMWICRLSSPHGPCGWRSWGEVPSRRSCVSSECCSKTYCKLLGKCGNWCINNDFLCLIKDGEYSYGKCSCANHLQNCDPDAMCRDRPEPLGGAFCQCNEGFYGNGLRCLPDPCHMSPCLPGDCRRATDGSPAYTCSCPPNYTAETAADGKQACTPKANICLTQPCGPDALDCVSFDDGYECICNDGYISDEATCVKIDWCAGDPCGPADAVHVCVSNLLDYTCFCREGYAVVTDANGTQRCLKDPCADNACGPSELVRSCKIERDDANEVSGYKCVCTDIATLQHSPDSKRPVCKLRDLCTDEPCGPQETAISCYMEGYSYQCVCQPGYSPGRRNGEVRCIRGDPCSTGACGDSLLVEECLTDGIAYSCTCVTGKSFLSRRAGDETEYCRDISVCLKWCGDLTGLESCHQDKDNKVDCKCGAGYVRLNTEGGSSCVEGDICTGEPCGNPEAVRECVVHGNNTYSCLCNEGFELRHFSNNSAEVCAAPNSCVGDPCGEAKAVVECVEGETSYECICEQPYTFKRETKGGKCVLNTGSPIKPEEPEEPTEETPKTEGSELSLWTLAACAGAGVLLLLLVGSGVVFKKPPADEDGGSDEVSIYYLSGEPQQTLQPANYQLYMQGPADWDSPSWA